MALITQSDVRLQISDALKEASNQDSNGAKFHPPVFRRPILSTVDTYDQNTQVDHLTEAFSTGTRPIWNVPRVAVTTEKVSTIKSSATVTTVSPVLATQSGLLSSPTTALATFTVVPNMAAVLRASGPVQISFSMNVQTVNANDPPSFAIFRNGIQVSQIYQGSGAANTNFLVTGTYTDNPPAGIAVYDLRWHKGASTVTASGKQRTFQISNLRAQ